MDNGWTSPEGLWLPKPVHMPDARNCSDVLTYYDEWDSGKTWDHHARWLSGDREVEKQHNRRTNANQIGPFCTFRGTGDQGHRSIVVRPTDAAMEAIIQRGIVTDDDHLSFYINIHNRDQDNHKPKALIVLSHGYIIGSIWLAYVDADTIPPRPERRAA